MAQSDNAAQPILDWHDKLISLANKVESWGQPDKKVDTSWHDEMVRKANESFRKLASSKASADPKLGAGKKKSATKKKTPVAAKRQ